MGTKHISEKKEKIAAFYKEKDDYDQYMDALKKDKMERLAKERAKRKEEVQKLEGEWDSKISGLKGLYEEKKRIRDEITKHISEKKEKIAAFYKEKDDYDQYMDALKEDKMER